MEKEIKTYMQYMYEKDDIVHDCIIQINKNLKRIILPDNTVGFRFFQKEFINNGDTIKEKIKNITVWGYIGKLMTPEELNSYFNCESNLLIELSQGNPTCITKNGNLLPLDDDDILYAESINKNNKVLKLK